MRAGYIDSSKRGVWALTEKGRTSAPLSNQEIVELVRDVINRWGSSTTVTQVASDEAEVTPPDESNTDYRAELLVLLQSLPPAGFERLCQRLLREAGFEEVTVTGRSGDGGMDGVGILDAERLRELQGLVPVKEVRRFGIVACGS